MNNISTENTHEEYDISLSEEQLKTRKTILLKVLKYAFISSLVVKFLPWFHISFVVCILFSVITAFWAAYIYESVMWTVLLRQTVKKSEQDEKEKVDPAYISKLADKTSVAYLLLSYLNGFMVTPWVIHCMQTSSIVILPFGLGFVFFFVSRFLAPEVLAWASNDINRGWRVIHRRYYHYPGHLPNHRYPYQTQAHAYDESINLAHNARDHSDIHAHIHDDFEDNPITRHDDMLYQEDYWHHHHQSHDDYAFTADSLPDFYGPHDFHQRSDD